MESPRDFAWLELADRFQPRRIQPFNLDQFDERPFGNFGPLMVEESSFFSSSMLNPAVIDLTDNSVQLIADGPVPKRSIRRPSKIRKFPSRKYKQNEKEKECSVCLEEYQVGRLIKQLPCGHQFHSTCILKWIKKSISCPLCRLSLE